MAIYGRSIGSGSRILGGGGPGMYSITLPRSVYYADAAEWVQVSPQSPAGDYRRQVIVGNSLWVFDGSSAYEVDLDTGLTLNTVTGCSLGGTVQAVRDSSSQGHYGTNAYAYPGGIASDGTNIYWLVSGSLMQLNTVTKSVTNIGSVHGSIHGVSLVYSPFDHSIYIIGGTAVTLSIYSATTSGSYYKTELVSNNYCYCYDITNDIITSKASFPIGISYPWLYSDNITGEIYIGGGITYLKTTSSSQASVTQQRQQYNHSIYKFNPSTNSYSAISTSMPHNFAYEHSYVSIADRMLAFSNQNVYSWNPKTGETYADQMPEPLTDAVLFNNVAVKDNSLYSSQGSGLYRCVFYEDIPANAPIVAKIYAGNKYHTTQPFTIHTATGDINVTTTQQTAEDDIEIKMYTYDNAGGQVLIVETGGD